MSIASHDSTLISKTRDLCSEIISDPTYLKLLEKVEVTMRWHDLRHFAVSLWIEQGFSIKEVMTFAGHSSIQMTMERYGHLFPSPDHQKAMAMVEAKLLG